jgi:hypothetical protein
MSSDETSDNNAAETKKDFGFLLDPSTKGGAVFIAIAAFIIPVIGYNVAVEGFGLDGIEVGKWIGVGFTVVACLGWAGTYIFRVANKDMTYVRLVLAYCTLYIFSRLAANERINSLTLTLCYFSYTHTQAKQLKDYENAVIAKRMEELDEDELQALVEEVERDDF